MLQGIECLAVASQRGSRIPYVVDCGDCRSTIACRPRRFGTMGRLYYSWSGQIDRTSGNRKVFSTLLRDVAGCRAGCGSRYRMTRRVRITGLCMNTTNKVDRRVCWMKTVITEQPEAGRSSRDERNWNWSPNTGKKNEAPKNQRETKKKKKSRE